MADDTAALVVSLEARFDKFEKAMRDIAKVVEQQTKVIEDRFDKMTSVISGHLEKIQGSLTSRLGIAGELLTKLGPAGIAAAVGIGAAVLALEKAAEWTLRFGEAMKGLRDLSMTTGISAETLQVLKKAAQGMGVDFDNVAPAIERFIRNWELLKRGQGEVRTELLRTNTALLTALNTAENETEAIQILSRAFQGLTASQGQLLARSAFGKAGGGDAFRFFSKGFDIAALQQQAAATNKIIKNDIVDAAAENFDKLQVNLKKLSDAAPKAFARIFGADILEKAVDFTSRLFEIVDSGFSKIEKRVGGGAETATKRISDAFEQFPEVKRPLTLTVTPKPPDKPLTPDETAQRSKDRIAFLGEAATAQEQLNNTLLQAGAATRANNLLVADEGRVRAEAVAATNRQIEAAREALGVASEQQILSAKLTEIERQRIKFNLDAQAAERAAVIATKEAREQYEAVVVRQSNLPGLTRLALDAANLSKQLDQFATGSLNTLVDSMADAVTGTKSLSDAFRDMTQSILKDLARLIIRQAVLAPLLGSFGLTGKADGGPVSAGVPYIVGERGPELFMPSGAGTIVPNNKLSGGAMSVTGPTTHVNVQGNADSSTVELMKQMFSQRDKRFVADVATATSELRRRSVRV